MCRLADIAVGEIIEPESTVTATKKNPVRTLSKAMRTISDMRRINIAAHPKLVYPGMVPAIQYVCASIGQIKRLFPGVPIDLANSEIPRALNGYGCALKCPLC